MSTKGVFIDYTEIEALVREKVHSLIFLGLDNEKLHAFFRENQLSDAEEFIEERLAMLTPAIEEPENPEMEKQELL